MIVLILGLIIVILTCVTGYLVYRRRTVMDNIMNALNFEPVDSEKDCWILTIRNKRTNTIVKKKVIKGPMHIGRNKSNDVVVRGAAQHRFELQIGMDEKGVFVNPVADHWDGKYAYGNGSYNVFEPKTTLVPKENEPLNIIYADLIYTIEKKTKKKYSAFQGGEISRYEKTDATITK